MSRLQPSHIVTFIYLDFCWWEDT